MSKTTEDLKAAFAGESQANRRYLAFAKKADQDGYPQVARLFRAAAAAETVHAHNHLRELGEVLGTRENLQSAINDENYEVVSMYPGFMQDSEAEGNKKVVTNFRWAWEAEKVHETLYKKALATLEEQVEGFDYYVCPVCGHTHEKFAPDRCPICNTPGKRFEKVS